MEGEGTGTIEVKRMRILKKKPDRRLHIAIAIVAMLVLPIFLLMQPSSRAEDYTFGSEDVIHGVSEDSANRNAEDDTYQKLYEEDIYENTNFTGSDETVTTGTTGGSFPDDLNTANDVYRTYIEADTGGAPPASYEVYLFPNGDVQTEWDTVYPSGDHYAQVDEDTEGSDQGATYLETGTNGDEDRFNLEDLGDPGAGYLLDIQIFGVDYKGASQPCEFAMGIRIGSTNYLGYADNPLNGAYSNHSSPIWMLNPSNSLEWTYSDIDSLVVYITTSDASPDVRCSQVGIRVLVNFTGSSNYRLNASFTFASVSSTSQTTGYQLLLEGKRSSTEDFQVLLYNYTLEDYELVATVQDGSDTDYSVMLTSGQRDASGEEIKIMFWDTDTASDTDQDTLSIDLCKIMRVELGYILDVEMTASGTNEYGNQTLKIKGYTSTENFYCGIFNWTSSGWDEQVITVSALSNTLYTFDLTSHHRSGSQEILINFTDADDHASDQTGDILYLDLVIVSWVHSDPTITLYGSDSPQNEGDTLALWANFTDADNEQPTYMRVNISGTTYDMTKNITDTSSWNGISYYYSTDALSAGIYNYNFTTKDANSGIVTTTTGQITINGEPVLSDDGVMPATGNNGDTFYFFVTYTDLYNNDTPSYIQVVIAGTPYDMSANDTDDLVYSDGKAYYYEKVMAAGDYQYYFKTADYLSDEVTTTPKDLSVNNIPTFSGDSYWPSDPLYVDTTIYFNITFTDIDGDLPVNIKWREDGGATQNESMVETDVGDSDTTDGKDYYYATTLGHGEHSFDFYADDGVGGVTGGSDSVTIVNRDPTIDNDPGAPSSYRNTYWDFDFEGSDPDTDSLTWEMNSDAVFLNINSGSGLVYGTTSDSVALYGVNVWCNDSYGGSDFITFNLNVINRAPVISSSGNTTQANNTFFCYTILASDDDGDGMTYEFNSNCSDLSIENHWVNGTVTLVGYYECNLWVNDSYGGSDYEQWFLTVYEPGENSPPFFTSTPITSNANNTAYEYDANATDPEGDSPLWFDLDSNCTQLSIDHDTGIVSGTPVGLGFYFVNVTVYDQNVTGGNLSAHQNYTLTLTNTAPEFTSSPTTTGTVGVIYSYDSDATDENGDDLTYAIEYKNATWIFIDDETGVLEGTPTVAGFYIINITVEDPFGGSDYQNFTITVSEAGAGPSAPSTPTTEESLQICFSTMMVLMILFFMYAILTKKRTKPATKREPRKGQEDDKR